MNTTVSQTTFTVHQDFENYDGCLSWTGAKTLRRYRELSESQSKLPLDKWGVFFAYSKDQFDRGYKGLVQRGLIKEGDKVASFGQGVYGLRDGMKRWVEECEKIDRQIAAECDPYEVYCEEYNNYECCIAWEGDERAVEKVLTLFGYERTRAVLTNERRFSMCGSLEKIWANVNKDN